MNSITHWVNNGCICLFNSDKTVKSALSSNKVSCKCLLEWNCGTPIKQYLKPVIKKERDFIELKIKPSGSNDLISFYKNASVFLQRTALALCVLY